MAQNYRLSARKRAAFRVARAALTPLSWAQRLARGRAEAGAGGIRSVLVVEAWQLGDAVLVTPLLVELRRLLPATRITMLCKAQTAVLLEQTGLVDDFVHFDFPWTAFTQKYHFARYSPAPLAKLVATLRARAFDVVLDARMDVRNDLLLATIGARRRVGYAAGGGDVLLSDALPAPGDGSHKIADWLGLLGALGMTAGGDATPRLALSEAERTAAGATLRRLGITPGATIVGIHPGARIATRRWPLERFAVVARHVKEVHGATVLLFEEPDGYGSAMVGEGGAVPVRGTLRELMALIARCNLVICNDSAPMHIAAALGVPTVSLFGPQRADWYGPAGEGHMVVQLADVPCRPCFDSCIFSEPFCLTGVTAEAVIRAVDLNLGAGQIRG